MVGMTKMRSMIGVMALLVGLPVLAGAQGTAPAPPPPPGGPLTPVTPGSLTPFQPVTQPAGAQPTGDQTWRDGKILWVACTLALTTDQARQIAQILTSLQGTLSAGVKLREQLGQDKLQAINTVLAAWLAGTQPDAVSLTSANDAANQVTTQDATEKQAVEAAGNSVLQLLTAAQRNQVEQDRDAQARAQNEMRLDGSPSIGDYIARELQIERRLMPEEYVAVRELNAARIASKIVNPRSNQYPRVEDAVLQLLDQVSRMSDQEFYRDLPTLPARVRNFLGITNDTVPKPVREDLFLQWLRDPRTAAYMSVYGTPALPLAAEPAAQKEPIRTALDSANIITFLTNLGLNRGQLAALLTVVGQAKIEVERVRLAKEGLMSVYAPDVIKALPLLISGQELPQVSVDFFNGAFAKLRDQDDQLTGALIPLVQSVQRIFNPRQANLIDWRVPPAVGATESPAERAKEAQADAVKVREAAHLVAGLRPFGQAEYIRVRVSRIEQLMTEYMDRGDPNFARVREQIGNIITDARGIPDAQWDSRVEAEVGARILQAVGQLQTQQWQPSNRQIDWYNIRELLVAPETKGILEKATGQVVR